MINILRQSEILAKKTQDKQVDLYENKVSDKQAQLLPHYHRMERQVIKGQTCKLPINLKTDRKNPGLAFGLIHRKHMKTKIQTICYTER